MQKVFNRPGESTRQTARPWGLREMRAHSGIGFDVGEWRYDHADQVAVDPAGQRIVFHNQTAPRTYSVPDPGQEDTVPDFVPDSAA